MAFRLRLEDFFELLAVRFLAKFLQKKSLRIATAQYSIVKLAITVRSGIFFHFRVRLFFLSARKLRPLGAK